MAMHGKILAFDPSGNFEEGRGTTGWSYFVDGKLKDFGDIKASSHDSAEAYWDSHLALINDVTSTLLQAVVCESFNLQPSKAKQQSWSALETPQLIGLMRHHCWSNGMHMVLQKPMIKQRFTDVVLEKTGVVEKRGELYYINGRLTNLHMRDSIRHGLYYMRYGKDEE